MASVNYAQLAKEAAKGFEPIPVGPYEVEVTGAESKTSSNNNPFYKVEFTLAAGPNKGRKVWSNITLNAANPNSVGYFFGTMRTLGLDAEFFAALPEDETDAQATICAGLLGKTAIVTIQHGEYNGSVTNDVDKIARSTSAGSSQPDVTTITSSDVASVPAAVTAAPASDSGLPPGL